MERDLTFKIDNNGTFTDFSEDAKEYLRDPVVNTFTAATDRVYIGLYKPYSDLYWEVGTALAGNALTLEYWDGSAWAALDFSDKTKSLSRSGFTHWQRPNDWAQTDIDGDSLYWVRASLGLDAELDIVGCNLVFADDLDLAKHQRDIVTKFKAPGDDSFIAYHVAARDEIIQRMRNGGKGVKRDTESFFRNFTQWDLLDIGQIREAAAHLALSKINFDVSEGVDDDKFFQKHKEHLGFFGQAFKLFFLSYDKDDDGIIDDGQERNRVRSVSIRKV